VPDPAKKFRIRISNTGVNRILLFFIENAGVVRGEKKLRF
jgi:hypothetical protein